MTGTIAILGSSGFVGGWLRRELQRRGAEDIWPPSPDVRIDIRDAGAVADLLDLDPAVIINLAAVASPALAAAQPVLADEVNHLAALRLASMVAERGRTRLIHIGSALCYGETLRQGVPVQESAPLRPSGVYAVSKTRADIGIGADARSRAATLRLRPFWHAGPGQDPQYVIGSFARQVARIMRGVQAPVIRVGNLDVQRDFTDVRDVVRLYADLAMAEDPGWGQVYNIASGRAISLRAVLGALVDRAGRSIEIDVDPARLRHDDIPYAAGNPSLVSALGWSPAISLEKTLDDMLQDWLEREDS